MTAFGSVAIVGLGSRGLNVLERLFALAERSGQPLRIELVDPVGTGAGVHAVDQPDYLLLNTICSQVTMFPDEHTVGDAVRLTGPTLHDWVLARDLRIADDGFRVGPVGRRIEPWDFLPRRLLGEYLAWFADLLLEKVPSNVAVRLHRDEAVGMRAASDGPLGIELAGGRWLTVDAAFLTTGYTDNAVAEHPGGRLISRPYPMPDRFSSVRPGETVAIGGFGLSALDAMSCLTVGRGGRFERRGGAVRYLPSGAEPRLLFYSRSGRPCRARPRVLRYEPPYRPLAFTPPAIDLLRAEAGGPLDFDRQVWPLVLTELRICHRRAEAARAGTAESRRVEDRLAGSGSGPGALLAALDELDAERGTFRPERLFDGEPMSLTGATGYQDWLTGELAADLAEGELGLRDSIVKRTLDVLRELRDTFRYAVDFAGLTPESTRRFYRHTVPLLNRAVVGPQFERHEELLSLFDAGLAQAPFGPDPSVDWESGSWSLRSRQLGVPHTGTADWLVAGRTDLPAVANSASPLLAQLFDQGVIRAGIAADPDSAGIDIDPDQHPVGADGEVDRRIWVLGPLCEGSTFYNNLVPSPGCWSRPFADAHRCAAELIAADRSLAIA